MDKFLKKMDSLPIVKYLQIAAVVIFVLGAVQLLLESIPGVFTNVFSEFSTFEGVVMSVYSFVLRLINLFYAPLLLLALAEIIKLLGGKKK